MKQNFKLVITNSSKELFNSEAKSLKAYGMHGEIVILPNHAPLLASIGEKLEVQDLDGNYQSFEIGHGILEVTPNLVSVIAT